MNTLDNCLLDSCATVKLRVVREILHCEAKKLHPCSFCDNLIKLRSSMPIFASIYLNVFVTKQCKNSHLVTKFFYSTKFNKRAKNCSTTKAKPLEVVTG